MQPFEIHEVHDRLWVGPCPHSPERIRSLRQKGITGLVCVQTDDDLNELGVPWALIWRFLMAQGIAAQRVPIQDFEAVALARGLPAAVSAVQDLHGAGHVTYLHCTAGLNRSPTVAIAWLIQHMGLDADSAWQQVTERRPCVPNRPALTRWQGAR